MWGNNRCVRESNSTSLSSSWSVDSCDNLSLGILSPNSAEMLTIFCDFWHSERNAFVWISKRENGCSDTGNVHLRLYQFVSIFLSFLFLISNKSIKSYGYGHGSAFYLCVLCVLCVTVCSLGESISEFSCRQNLHAFLLCPEDPLLCDVLLARSMRSMRSMRCLYWSDSFRSRSYRARTRDRYTILLHASTGTDSPPRLTSPTLLAPWVYLQDRQWQIQLVTVVFGQIMSVWAYRNMHSIPEFSCSISEMHALVPPTFR